MSSFYGKMALAVFFFKHITEEKNLRFTNNFSNIKTYQVMTSVSSNESTRWQQWLGASWEISSGEHQLVFSFRSRHISAQSDHALT